MSEYLLWVVYINPTFLMKMNGQRKLVAGFDGWEEFSNDGAVKVLEHAIFHNTFFGKILRDFINFAQKLPLLAGNQII